MPKTQLHTPQHALSLFKGKIFPISDSKRPIVKDWPNWQGTIKSGLAALNLNRAGISVIDIDLYKPTFKANEKAVTLRIALRALGDSIITQKTLSGGEHYLFKYDSSIGIKNTSFDAVDIKTADDNTKGGYIGIYNDFSKYTDFDTFYSNLITIPPNIVKLLKNLRKYKKTADLPMYGPKQNNKAIPSRVFPLAVQNDRAGYEAEIELFRKCNPDSPQPEIDKHLEDFKKSWDDGQKRRETLINRCINVAAQLKVSEESIKSFAKKHFMAKINTTNLETKGDRVLHKLPEIKGDIQQEFDAMTEALGVKTRRNTLKCINEINFGTKWQAYDEITETKLKNLYNQKCVGCDIPSFKVEYRFGPIEKRKLKGMHYNEYHLHNLFIEEYDALKLYFTSLPKVNNTDLIDRYMAGLFVTDAAHNIVVKWHAKALLVAIVARTFEPGCNYPYMTILQGKQGIGKSLFTQQLFPEHIRHLCVSAQDPFTIDGKRLMKVLKFPLIEVAELDSFFKKKHYENIKAFVTRQIDQVQGMWERYSKEIPRRTVLVGTVNGTEFLSGEEDQRRYPVFKLKQNLDAANIKTFFKTNRDRLWAEALMLYRAGFDLNATNEVKEAAQSISSGFRQTNEMLNRSIDRIVTKLLYAYKEKPKQSYFKPMKSEKYKYHLYFDIADFARSLSDGSFPTEGIPNQLFNDRSDRAVRRALMALGWAKKKVFLYKDKNGKAINQDRWVKDCEDFLLDDTPEPVKENIEQANILNQ